MDSPQRGEDQRAVEGEMGHDFRVPLGHDVQVRVASARAADPHECLARPEFRDGHVLEDRGLLLLMESVCLC